MTVSKNGTISDPTIGQDGATIAKFKVEASGEDATLKQIALNVDQSTDHSNYKLWKGATLLALRLDRLRELLRAQVAAALEQISES